jgi:hypothetical protein
MIAEIVSLSGYEAQVSALLTEEERMATGILHRLCARRSSGHPRRRRKDNLSAADQTVQTKLATQIKKAGKGGT